MGHTPQLVLSLFPGIGPLRQMLAYRWPGDAESASDFIYGEARSSQLHDRFLRHVHTLIGRKSATGIVVLPMAMPTQANVVSRIVVTSAHICPIVSSVEALVAAVVAALRSTACFLNSEVERLITRAVTLPEMMICSVLGGTYDRSARGNAVALHETPNDLLAHANPRRNFGLRLSCLVERSNPLNEDARIGFRCSRASLVDSFWHAELITSQCQKRKRSA